MLCVGVLGEMIKAQIGDGSDIGVQITYSFDGPNLLGTGGALKRSAPESWSGIRGDYGDSYMPVDYGAVVEAFVRAANRL